jgi:hypothetical protein
MTIFRSFALALAERHCDSGDSISVTQWTALNLRLFAGTPIKWNTRGFQTTVSINFLD